ncbi:MAG: hypothetical protein E7089_06010 [Bacteroidales bacterium]|nr:hypothetical protein [Bacteroidales bacterium]
MRIFRIFISAIMLLWCSATMADSPLTETYFADVYKSKKIVKRAIKADGKITRAIMKYLADKDNPVDVKIAAVNALQWDTDNYPAFLDYLKEKYNTFSEITLFEKLDASTLISLAYVKAMGDYNDVMGATIIAEYARKKICYSFTVNMISALIKAQMYMNDDFCVVFKFCNSVVKNENLTMDMHPKAVERIVDYINIYSKYCNE